MQPIDQLLEAVRWNEHGLVAAIAQDHQTQQVLMMAWMNAEALKLTIETGWVHYYSRSRQKLWKKGESSGHCQRLDSLSLDCDGDAILMGIEQIGQIACHTGRSSCFYRQLQQGQWVTTLEIIKPAEAIYGKPDQESAHD